MMCILFLEFACKEKVVEYYYTTTAAGNNNKGGQVKKSVYNR
jgi:hypothetical protein